MNALNVSNMGLNDLITLIKGKPVSIEVFKNKVLVSY